MSIEKRLIWFCGVALLAMPAMAQNAPILRPGVTEVGGFIGASYGIDKTRVMGGGNVVYSLTKTFMPFAEVSYFPGIGRSQQVVGIAGSSQVFSLPLVDFNAGFHLRIPIPKSRDHTLRGHQRRWDSHPRAYFQRNLSEPGDSDADRFAVRPTLMRAPISPPASVQVFATIRPSVLDFARSSRPISRLTRVPTTTCFTG